MKRKLSATSYSRLYDFIHCKLRYYHGVVEGLRVKPEHLPEAVKLGRAWEAFVRHLHDEKYDYRPEIGMLQLSPKQTAKISALTRAYRDLEIQSPPDGLLGCQYRIHTPVGQNQIVGYVDRAYVDHITEVKLSVRPDFYRQKENIAYQLGTYLMANEAWESATVEITRVPTLRTGKGRYDNESPEEFEERCYGDILSRPAHYFMGWDRKVRTYGVRFWRSEFDLDEIFSTYVHVLREIQETVTRGTWYANNFACHVPAACPFLPIKRSGVVSEEIYERRRKGGETNEQR
jgi:hypothetical protein